MAAFTCNVARVESPMLWPWPRWMYVDYDQLVVRLCGLAGIAPALPTPFAGTAQNKRTAGCTRNTAARIAVPYNGWKQSLFGCRRSNSCCSSIFVTFLFHCCFPVTIKDYCKHECR
ncbi:hypothetical protein NPIL_403321 [Nephila pilipes]|uniref:Uncharacterized protein n=1 Tax=Nephila pilipes TaxID=299642 RepID=A0A8X6TBB8_NEPPI|nr:hypothetical protein NPIL_403321 [Nephila pilipes]